MTDPAPSGCPTPPPRATDQDQLFVIGSAAQAFYSLAALAPGLTEAELRVTLYLASIQDPATHSAKASSRQIAEATRLARSNVIRAVDSLTRRCLIATRAGSGQTASGYLLNFTQTTALRSGPIAGPLAQTTLPLHYPEVVLQQDHTHEPQTALDRSITSDSSILDRVLTARPQHFQASDLDTVRRWAYKWLCLQRGAIHHPQPPDMQVCARIAAAAEGAYNAQTWISGHLEDRGAETCEYLVVWMLQIIHGYAPPTTKRRRAELRLVGKQRRQSQPADSPAPAIGEQPTPDAGEQPSADPFFSKQLTKAAIAGVRKLR